MKKNEKNFGLLKKWYIFALKFRNPFGLKKAKGVLLESFCMSLLYKLLTLNRICMKKVKLIKRRKEKGFTQSEMGDKLFMDVSNYGRRENGQVKIARHEWEKLAKILETSVDDIFEADDNQPLISQDSSNVQNQETDQVYSIPKQLIETTNKYIEKLEKEVRALRKMKKV